MKKIKLLQTAGQESIEEKEDAITAICRRVARKMLATAPEAEVEVYLEQYGKVRDEKGRRQVVRNGYLPERTIQTGPGETEIRQPRIEDGRRTSNGERMRFSSKILPPYLRRTKQMEELIPWLCLKDVSGGDFCEALLAFYDFPAEHLETHSHHQPGRVRCKWRY